MSKINNLNIQEDNDLKRIVELLLRNYLLFLACVIIALGGAFLVNLYSVPIYQISASVLIKEDMQKGSGDMNDYLNSSLFGKNQNFQNELLTLQSTPVIEQTIKNLDLSVTYYRKENYIDIDAYNNNPFRIILSKNHVQPLNVRFKLNFLADDKFLITAEAEKVAFYNFSTSQYENEAENWSIKQYGKIGKLIETNDLSFIIVLDSNKRLSKQEYNIYSFEFIDENSLTNYYKGNFSYKVKDKMATVIEINCLSASVPKGIDMVNELMNVYSIQNLNRKNHIASITIDYIEKQLSEISDSLNLTEDNLQQFRSSNQLLDVAQQATGITEQYRNLQNQRAELVSRKRYYDYVADYISKNDDFSNLIVPSSMGIPDQILTNLMSQLIASQAQRSNLISNNQEKNPLVKKLDIQIANIKKSISDNIAAVRQTTDISIDEMNKRVGRIEGQISNLPKTQRQLGGIERKYRLNDAIYNYLLEKRAEAKITKASNLPDDIILEPAINLGQVSPNKNKNYIFAFILGLGLPFSYLFIKKALNYKIENQDDIEHLTQYPVLGKILHNYKKTNNVVFEYPTSSIAESYRALRTNLEFYLVKGDHKKIILVTSCIEGEGKSFNALNIAMSYAQLGRKTLLLDFDLRKPTPYFNKKEEFSAGLSSFLIDQNTLKEITISSPHDKLDYICSGPIPPNPAELLALEKTENLIDDLKNQYDYIIIDTPPLAQVTDGYLLIEKADIKIIIARYNYSKKSIFSIVMKDLRQKNIDNVCIVLNDNRIERDQYGYGYGYNKKKKFGDTRKSKSATNI
jgi:tyrosine-protein kinase Etk/Wzc